MGTESYWFPDFQVKLVNLMSCGGAGFRQLKCFVFGQKRATKVLGTSCFYSCYTIVSALHLLYHVELNVRSFSCPSL